MKICLISLIEDIGCNSLRYLSSYIKKSGHETVLVFLPRQYSEGWGAHESYRYPYSKKTLNQVTEICSDSDVIGLSLMSCHFDNAIYITRFLKKLGKPIMWGGIHPTINSEECLKYADVVCVGEGEVNVVEFLNNPRMRGVLKNKTIEDLDELGFPDYDFKNQYILYKGSVVKLNKEILSECLCGVYRTLFSRGCAMACSYCCNNVLKQLYGIRPIRWRSLDKQIEELKIMKETIGLKTIDFADDTFLSRPYEQIERFVLKYKNEIGLPFKILTIPLSVSYDKIKILKEAGLYDVGIGVQSVYEPVRKMYNRHESVEQIKRASEIIKDFGLTVRYDFITDNPWGGNKDIEENIRFAMTLPKPRDICIFSLVFYYGTELYMKAKEDGFIKDDLNEVYRMTQLMPRNIYLNEVFSLVAMGCPEWLIRGLLKYRSIMIVKIVKDMMNFMWYVKNPQVISEQKCESVKFNGVAGETI